MAGGRGPHFPKPRLCKRGCRHQKLSSWKDTEGIPVEGAPRGSGLWSQRKQWLGYRDHWPHGARLNSDEMGSPPSFASFPFPAPIPRLAQVGSEPIWELGGSRQGDGGDQHISQRKGIGGLD